MADKRVWPNGENGVVRCPVKHVFACDRAESHAHRRVPPNTEAVCYVSIPKGRRSRANHVIRLDEALDSVKLMYPRRSDLHPFRRYRERRQKPIVRP